VTAHARRIRRLEQRAAEAAARAAEDAARRADLEAEAARLEDEAQAALDSGDFPRFMAFQIGARRLVRGADPPAPMTAEEEIAALADFERLLGLDEHAVRALAHAVSDISREENLP
jgi:hypothetical protein